MFILLFFYNKNSNTGPNTDFTDKIINITIKKKKKKTLLVIIIQ